MDVDAMSPDAVLHRQLEVGRWLEAADEAAWRQARDTRLTPDRRADLARSIRETAHLYAVRALGRLVSLHSQEVTLWRAQAVMAEMLGEIAGLLATAAVAMRGVNEALAEERRAAA
jgi:hypothetical protein